MTNKHKFNNLYVHTNPQFGGKLVSFGNTRGENTPKTVHVSQVTTEHELLKRSCDLEDSLSRQQFVEFCEKKVQESNDDKEKNIWSFLKVNTYYSMSSKGFC